MGHAIYVFTCLACSLPVFTLHCLLILYGEFHVSSLFYIAKSIWQLELFQYDVTISSTLIQNYPIVSYTR